MLGNLEITGKGQQVWLKQHSGPLNHKINLFYFFPTKDDNITFAMTMTASGPLSLCIIKYCGDIRAPAAKQYFSKTYHA